MESDRDVLAMSDASEKIPDWGTLYRESLNTEILRSERLRATILALLFAFSICVYTFFAFTPGFVDDALRSRLRDHWPWFILLFGLALAFECFVRVMIGQRIAARRQPPTALRYLNALLETSIPTAMLFNASGLMGPRDALGSPAFLLYFFFIMLSILRLDTRLCLFTGLVAAIEHFAFAYMVLRSERLDSPIAFWLSPVYHFNRSFALAAAGLVAGLLARQIKKQVEASLDTARERDQAVRIFGQYVSPQIADKLLHQPVELGGELRSVCVMFLDIRDFSSFAASARPEAVMAYLNTLFDFMIDVINAHQGIVNKFLGDGFMAVFGAPIDDADQCRHALDASLSIIKRLEVLNGLGEIHPTRIGIGLHMGEAVAGNVGSSDRKEYAIIGDVVNLAARLEQATKELKAQLLISDAVRQALVSAAIQVEDLGPIELKGQPHPVRVFKVA